MYIYEASLYSTLVGGYIPCFMSFVFNMFAMMTLYRMREVYYKHN